MIEPRSGSQLNPDSPIPEKLYFKIGEVSQLVGVETHVLRYWEKEVPSIRPGKSVSNQRRYRRKDVEAFREIRKLLHQDRYTLAGARRQLALLRSDKGKDRSKDRSKNRSKDSGKDRDKVHRPSVESPSAPVSPTPEPRAAKPAVPVEQLECVKSGLRELIRLAGEDP